MEFEGKIEILKSYVNDHIIGRIGNSYVCDCKGYKMSRKKPKSCKHIEEIKRLELFVQDKLKLENELRNILERKNKILKNFYIKHPIVKRIDIKENEESNTIFVDVVL